jgi:predicted nucleotidyltransferase
MFDPTNTGRNSAFGLGATGGSGMSVWGAAFGQTGRNAGEVSGRVWLIGSYAWGQPDARSDIDLLMETCPNRFGMMQRIEDPVGLDVDVILVDEADPRLLPHLQREGILL